jgi:sulfate transport system permease protein
MSTATKRVLPGFNITLGFTVFYLCLIVLIPLSALLFKTFTLTWPQFWEAVTAPRVMASYRLTFSASLAAAVLNALIAIPGQMDYMATSHSCESASWKRSTCSQTP